jgi:hypothetical protein
MSFRRRSALGALVAALLVLILLFPSASVRGQSQATNTVSVVVQVHVSPVYDFYGSGTAVVDGVISAKSLSLIQSTVVELLSTSTPAIGAATTVVKGKVLEVSYTSLVNADGLFEVDFKVPANATSLSISFQESRSGSGFLWRYIAAVPFVEVVCPALIVQPVTTMMIVPSGTVLSQLYTAGGGSLPSYYAAFSGGTAGQSTYSLVSGVGLIVMQSNLFVPASVAITSVALAVLVLAGLNLLPSGQQVLARISGQIKRLRIPGINRKFRLRAILHSRKLLALFILCSLIMAAGAALGGPNPRVTAYVLAAPGSMAAIQSNLQQVAPNVQVITPSEDFTDFAVMSSVGQFSMVVVSNYPPASLAEVSGFILGSLGNVPVIVVDNSVNSNLTNTIDTLYGSSVVHVQNASALTAGQMSTIASDLEQSKGSSLLGISLGERGFEALLATEAVLSMALVFLGWAYLGSIAADPESRRDLSHIVTVIGAGIFVFVFSEAVYVGVSSLLRFPLSLHAVTSDAHDLTAIGLLGFGGGSTPRLAAGFLGVLVGLVGTEGGLRVRKSDFALVSAALLLIVANPFSIGQFAFQALLGFIPLSGVGVGTTQLGTAYTSLISLKEFILGVGSALGGSVTPQYLLSAGKTLFFASLVPLAYVKKMGRTTTAIAVLAVALIAGDGGVRVGEMTPDKTVIAILPGLALGFAFAAVLLGLAVVEKYVRRNWRSKG